MTAEEQLLLRWQRSAVEEERARARRQLSNLRLKVATHPLLGTHLSRDPSLYPSNPGHAPTVEILERQKRLVLEKLQGVVGAHEQLCALRRSVAEAEKATTIHHRHV